MRVLFIVLSVIGLAEARRGAPSQFGTLTTPYTFYTPSGPPRFVEKEEPKVKEVKAVKTVKATEYCPHTKTILGHDIDCKQCLKKVDEAMGGLE